MWTQLVVANTAKGAMNIGQAPTQTAIPRVRMTSPKYMGLRVNRYGPLVTSLRLVGEVGSISVCSRRNRKMAETGKMSADASRAIFHGRDGQARDLWPTEPPTDCCGYENRNHSPNRWRELQHHRSHSALCSISRRPVPMHIKPSRASGRK